MTPKITAWMTLLATLVFGVSPYFIPPFTGFTADLLPIPQPDPVIQPAGYAFSIWGVIYIWLFVSAIFGVWKRSDDPAWSAAQILLIPALLLGAAWNGIANLSAIWATIVIWVMLIFAIMAALKAPAHDRWLLKGPLALLAGWLSAASFVSLGVTLPGYGILFDGNTWAAIGIIVATILAIIIQGKLGAHFEYGIAVVWALVGIIIGNTNDVTMVTLIANASIVALVVNMIWIARNRQLV